MKRIQTLGEEIANSVSHGAGVIAVIVGAPFLILAAVHHHSPFSIVGTSVFIASMLILYSVSSLYHAITNPTAKRVFRILDHGAIYILIAGTYTPFAIGPLRGPWGWTLFGVLWGLAAAGVTLKATNALWHPVLSAMLYLLMGWALLFVIHPFWQQVSHAALLWLLAGGICYSGGVVFFASQKKYAHFVWHLCVIGGTVCHYFAVLWFAA